MARRRPLIFGVAAWGSPVGQGVYDARFCTLGGVVKADQDPTQSCTAANEYICNRLALALGLPAPPGGLIRTEDGQPAFVSMRFGSLTESPPPVVPPDFVKDQPRIAAGIVAFDCWIANSDRHERNLAYRRGTIPPAIFDHGLCLGGESRSAIPQLPTRVDEPGFNNCLAPLIQTSEYLDEWRFAISGLPKTTISAIIEDIVGVGLLTIGEGNLIAGFLRSRQGILRRLLERKMPQVLDWGLF